MTLNTRSMFVICATTAAWAFSFGLGQQVVSLWLKDHQASDTVVGLAHSFYYFGLAVASCGVPALTRRLGPTTCAALGMIAAGTTLAAFPWASGKWGWYLLRFCNGCAGAMSLVPLETIVSSDSQPGRRTQNFAYYGVALTLGGALGIGLGLSLYERGNHLEFYYGGAIPIVAGILVIALLQRPALTDDEGRRTPLGWSRNFLSYGTAWCQGFLEGGMLAFLSLFLLSRGFTESIAGALMSATMVGVILFQVPVSWLADRFGKTPMLLGCYAVVAVGLATIPWLADSLELAICLFCFGACTGAMYPLGLSLLGDGMPASGLARAYAWYLAVECVGSQIGAAAMGRARDAWGEAAMFSVGLGAVLGVLAIWFGLQQLRRDRAVTAGL